MTNILVYSNQDIELPVGKCEQLAIFFSAESRLANGLTMVPTLGKKKF